VGSYGERKAAKRTEPVSHTNCCPSLSYSPSVCVV